MLCRETRKENESDAYLIIGLPPSAKISSSFGDSLPAWEEGFDRLSKATTPADMTTILKGVQGGGGGCVQLSPFVYNPWFCERKKERFYFTHKKTDP